MTHGIGVILVALFFLSVLGILTGCIYASWNLVKYHSHLSATEKRKKWFRDFWLTWFDIVSGIFDAF